MRLRDDLALTMQLSQNVTALVGDHQLDDVRQSTQPVAEGDEEVVDALPRDCRDRNGPRVGVDEPFGLVGEIGLVEDEKLRDTIRADLVEHDAHRVDLAVRIRRRRVDDMHQEVGRAHHFERRLERLDELMGQLADEADRVRDEYGLAAGKLHALASSDRASRRGGPRRAPRPR